MQKPVAVTLVILLLITLGVGAFYFLSSPKTPNATDAGALQPKELTASKTLKTYENPSGFTFSYPDNFSLLNKGADDPELYASIELTSQESEGTISLIVEDTKYATFSAWLKANKEATQSAKPTETRLGLLPANQLQNDGKIVLLAIDKGVLFTLKVVNSKDEAFWQQAFNVIRTSFAIAPPAQSAGGGSTAGGTASDVIFEAEETVE